MLQLILHGACRAEGFQIYAYCIMPDHLHLEPIGLLAQSSLPNFVRRFKGQSTVALRNLGHRNAWQKGFHDHVNRPGELERIAAYIFENPVRAQLVRDMYEWSHSGSFVFDWKKFAPPVERFTPPWKEQCWRDKPAATSDT